LAHHRFRGNGSYRRFQVYQGYLVLNYLIEQGVNLQNTRVLDLGCGNGGYSYVMASAGARVTSVDLRVHRNVASHISLRLPGRMQVPALLRTMERPQARPPSFVLANAMQLPFDSNCFPVVFCASLIEHVADQARLLAEIKRVLIPGGVVYLSFPPFYSPVGGHQFKPYHLLGERWALRLSKHRAGDPDTSYADWGLYPLTVRQARQLFAEAEFEIRHESTRFLPLNVARLPVLGELLTWHVQFILCAGS
jgi:SAM-dependent methyltransferase